MSQNKKRGFFERLTGAVRYDDDEEEIVEESIQESTQRVSINSWMEEENDEAELAVDVYQTPTDIVVQTMVAGVNANHLEITIGRDLITIKGKRATEHHIDDENYFTKELYWGKFSRTIMLPQEVEPDEAEATEKHGLLTIKLQKVDKEKKANLKVKSV